MSEDAPQPPPSGPEPPPRPVPPRPLPPRQPGLPRSEPEPMHWAMKLLVGIAVVVGGAIALSVVAAGLALGSCLLK